MKIFIAVTDNDWFEMLSHLDDVDEVNFWQPSGRTRFQALQPGEPFLFKLHSPLNYIVGGGFFAHSTIFPSSLAWEAFGEKNGASSLIEMRKRIIKYRNTTHDLYEDFQIGCIILEQPFFLAKADWIPVPSDWKMNIVRGKTYELNSDPGKSIWERVQYMIKSQGYQPMPRFQIEEAHAKYGKEILVKPRLGQGAFKVLVTDAYNRSCAITRERTLPVLEAAHIKPYSESGPHNIQNGILLRSDMHRLFDKGYLTVTPQLHVEVSRRIKEEFDNGKYYFTFHGKVFIHLENRQTVRHPNFSLGIMIISLENRIRLWLYLISSGNI